MQNKTISLYQDCLISIYKVEEVIGDNRFYDFINTNPKIKERLIKDDNFKLTKNMLDEFYK